MIKTVYITGCLGFIGSYITRTCLHKGWYVKGVDKMTYASSMEALKEFKLMLAGLEIVFRQFPTGRTLYFLNAHHNKLANRLDLLGQSDILYRLSEMDPSHKDIYLKGLKKK